MSRYRIAFVLIIIGIFSLGLKLYTVEFSIPINSDNLNYALDAISYSKGEIFIDTKKNPGWPMFISLLTYFIDSNKFIDYSNLIRILSIGISLLTILPMYIFARKFFNEKYSIVAASLFAFEPHLNYNSNLGLAEPLYIFVMITSFFLILNKNEKFVYFSFALAGILWWIRIEGIILFMAVSIIFFLNFSKTSKVIPKYLLCLVIFILVISPIFVLRELQFDDPLYFGWNKLLDVRDYEKLQALNISESTISEQNSTFAKERIVWGLSIFEILIRVLFPYLIILIPFGILFSLKTVDQNSKFIKANWIMILVTISILTLIYTINPDRRYLFQLYPFLIIFSILPIKWILDYRLSKFSFDERKKNVFLIIIIFLILLLGGLFTTLRFGSQDLMYENEKIKFARFLIENFNGGILDAGNAIEYLRYAQIVNPEGIFDKNIGSKNLKNPLLFNYIPGRITQTIVSEKSLHELILVGKENGLKYIAVKENETFIHLHYLDDVYANEQNYSYLKKVFDSKEEGFQKLKVKVFEIDYEKFG